MRSYQPSRRVASLRSTPAVIAQSWPGRSSLGSPSNGPAVTLWTSTPGASSTVAGWPPDVARVNTSTSVPRAARRRETSAM
jgi:hypothetical protein